MTETPLTPSQIAQAEQAIPKEGWIKRDLVALDQAGNVILLHGLPDETISAHAARDAAQGKHWAEDLVKFLDVFQEQHGQKAIVGDRTRGTEIVTTEDQALGLKK